MRRYNNDTKYDGAIALYSMGVVLLGVGYLSPELLHSSPMICGVSGTITLIITYLKGKRLKI
jgi:hypothetical protein